MREAGRKSLETKDLRSAACPRDVSRWYDWTYDTKCFFSRKPLDMADSKGIMVAYSGERKMKVADGNAKLGSGCVVVSRPVGDTCPITCAFLATAVMPKRLSDSIKTHGLRGFRML